MIQLIFLEDGVDGTYYVYLNGSFLYQTDEVDVDFVRILLERVVKSPISIEEYYIPESKVNAVLHGSIFPLNFNNINTNYIEEIK